MRALSGIRSREKRPLGSPAVSPTAWSRSSASASIGVPRRSPLPTHPRARRLIAAVALVFAVTASAMTAMPAAAHGFSTVVYVDATAESDATVRTELELEYDLLVVSVADYED